MRRLVPRAAWALAWLACAGCGRSDAPQSTGATVEAREPAAAAPHPRLAPRAERALTAKRLPEDPIAGARSTEQWRQRRAARMRMRQQLFDADHLAVHRTLFEQLAEARARYDRARNEAALKAVRAALPVQLDKLKASVSRELDTGRGSGLLADYAALLSELESSYPDAKLASLRGDASALPAAQARFDQRVQAMGAWLAEAQETAVSESPHATTTVRDKR